MGVVVGLRLRLVIASTYLLVAQTKLREWVVPGYVAESTRQDMRETRAMADSLSSLLRPSRNDLTALRHACGRLRGAGLPSSRSQPLALRVRAQPRIRRPGP